MNLIPSVYVKLSAVLSVMVDLKRMADNVVSNATTVLPANNRLSVKNISVFLFLISIRSTDG